MATIGTFEAKTHFSQLIAEVEKGKDYTVTRRGKPVAKIIPFPQEKKESLAEGIRKLGEYARLHWKGDEPFDIREAIEEGRP
ncbi:MAG: type II toxin-antitoxin system prevent-host-death family antitoxin [Treponema sp.]|jgi:prevent-host-death family protein|nr:type II toxin-antitoxin system prevent-host-death family antitoxin [Treponema sp.]